MPKNFVLRFVIILSLASTILPVNIIRGQAERLSEGWGKPLCLPAAYPQDPGACLPLGPSTILTEMAANGMDWPISPLPATKPDPSLVQVEAYYARINLESSVPAPVYSTLDDAIAETNPVRSIAPGMLRYLSYINYVRNDNGKFVQLKSGEWTKASPAAYSPFQGLLFSHTPRHSFGWILDTTESRQAPGYSSAVTGKVYYQYHVVPVYAVIEADKTQWYQVGLDEWVERRYIRQVILNLNPPEGVSGTRWIEINLGEQTIAVYENRRLVFASLVASGVDPFYTQPGVFQIYQKKPLETMSGAFEADRSDFYYLEDVPWTMYYDQARAIHGAYWRTLFGYPQSHGCVNLSPGDSAWVYQWAKEGDWVYVWDSTGQTPTDPSYYGQGGA